MDYPFSYSMGPMCLKNGAVIKSVDARPDSRISPVNVYAAPNEHPFPALGKFFYSDTEDFFKVFSKTDINSAIDESNTLIQEDLENAPIAIATGTSIIQIVGVTKAGRSFDPIVDPNVGVADFVVADGVEYAGPIDDTFFDTVEEAFAHAGAETKSCVVCRIVSIHVRESLV